MGVRTNPKGSYSGGPFMRDLIIFGSMLPAAPNVALLRALWSLLDGTWGILNGS